MSPPSYVDAANADKGQSYAGIKDEIRRDLAIEMLLNGKSSVGEIAAQLGFSEPSAFHRAFRKWTSKSPAAFRRETGLVDARSESPEIGRKCHKIPSRDVT